MEECTKIILSGLIGIIGSFIIMFSLSGWCWFIEDLRQKKYFTKKQMSKK